MIVFARMPRAGAVKTRLASAIGDDEAAAFYKECAEHLLKGLSNLASTHVTVWCADASDVDAMRAWLGDAKDVRAQIDGDLGARMRDAFERMFSEQYREVVIVGTDIPDLAAAHITAAFDALDRGDVVLGPARDGGYYLLGMKHPLPLFDGIAWGTDEVAAATRNKIAALCLSCMELETLDDIDTVDDLRRYRQRAGS